MPADLPTINSAGFARDIDALRARTNARIGIEDFRHLRKLERIGRLGTLLALATAWIFPNPLTVCLFALGIGTRWLLMHHIGHGGYDRIEGIPKRYTSSFFAAGWRRYVDWYDWMIPAGWRHEHEILHHYYTGEDADPDLVERNIEDLRNARVPRIFKYVFLFFAAITWKFTYYAPNTLNALESKRRRKNPSRKIRNITRWNFLNPANPLALELWGRCYMPYVLGHFIVLPALFLPLGPQAALFVLINRVLAEFLHNFHAMMVIAPNHAGDDLYRFDHHYRDRAEFYVNQVLGTVNFRCGTEWLDYSQLWLNYQIEHHLAPNLPALKYREIQPEVRALCDKHGIPYVQQSVWKRFGKFIAICVGDASMKRLPDPTAEQRRVA